MERNLLLELPKDIIFHIISYLTTRDAVRLSCASKQALNLVQERPHLSFEHPTTINIQAGQPTENKYRDEYDYIVSSLDRYRRQDTRLETFTVKVDGLKDDGCIELVAETGVRSLTICTTHGSYVLPKSVIEVESLVELELTNCVLPPIKRVAWPNLKRLALVYGCKASQEAFEVITRGCPLIENLQFQSNNFTSWFNLHIANLRKLKQLNVSLRYGERLEVDARSTPNLESISCQRGHVDLGDTEYPNLRRLNLQRCKGIGHQFFTDDFARKFPMLEYLSLVCTVKTLQRINLRSTSLKKIDLIYERKYRDEDELQEACFQVPNLVCFKYSTDIESLPQLSFAGKSSGWRSCIDLYKHSRCLDASWLLQLNEFLAALSGSEASVVLTVLSGFFTEEEKEERHQFELNFHQSVVSCLERVSSITRIIPVREFSIDTGGSSSSFTSAVTDCIFLICQPRTITFLKCKNYEIPKQFHEKLKSTSGRRAAGFSSSQSSARFNDWDKFMEALQLADENDGGSVKNISFHLEYI